MTSAAQRVNVQTLLNEHPFSPFQWVIFALCFTIVLLDGFDTAAIGYITPSLMKEWGVAKPALAPLLSAALFGLCIGSLSAGPLADTFGRRRVLNLSVLVFGVACLGSAFAADLMQLTIARFVTGLGLGAAMPNAVTLMSEYCPDKRRAMLTNLMFCGFPLGAALGGFLAAWMIPQWGWRSVLVLGGVAPLLLLIPLLLMLPESVRYMVSQHQPVERIRATLARMVGAATVASVQHFTMTEHRPVTNERGGIAQVLSGPYRIGSVMLWLTYFMGLVIFYSLINWMPVLFKDAGIDPKTAMMISALFPLGGVGAVLLGWFMDRFDANRIVAIGFALTAGAVWFIGQAAGDVGVLMAAVFLAGSLMNMAQSSLPALAAAFYPTNARATGVAWMMGIGRFGGIAGSFLVAELSARQVGFAGIFSVLAVPALLAAGALLIKQACDPAGRHGGKPPRAKLQENLGH